MLKRLTRLARRWIDATSAAANAAGDLVHREDQRFFAAIQDSARAKESGRLLRFTRKVFSQGMEDGVLEEIFRRIGVKSRAAIEIGCSNGLENNTMYLVFQGWQALWIDANSQHIAAAQQSHRAWLATGQLKLKCALITQQNVAGEIGEFAAARGADLDLLTVDIDSYDFWVLKAALNVCNPRVIVVEYNGHFAPPLAITVPNGAKLGGSFYGASLAAFVKLLDSKYALVGCTANGVNAFFVRRDLDLSSFSAPFTSENHFEPLAFAPAQAYDVSWVQV
jgi:hypothetical protein